MSKIEQLYRLNRSVFTINDLRIIWAERNPDALKTAVKYYVDRGKLLRLRKGVYVLDEDYNQFELAQKLILPSYISLETALQKHGIIFQFTSAVTSVASYTRKIQIREQVFEYHAVKEDVLFNNLGVVKENHFFIASPERAICDFVYFNGPSHLDNLRDIDSGLIKKIAGIYGKKSVKKFIDKLITKL